MNRRAVLFLALLVACGEAPASRTASQEKPEPSARHSPSKVEDGAKVPPRLGVAATDLEAGIIDLDVGTVTQRNVLQDGLEAVAVAGTNARVFWTWRLGRTEIFLHWAKGATQSVVVNVAAEAPQ